MWNKMKNVMFGRDIELRERLFRMILLVGLIVSGSAIFECLFFMKNPHSVYFLYFAFIVMAISFYITLKYRKCDIPAIIVGIVLIAIAFPWVFFMCGGTDSGAMVWFSLELVYVFVMFSGKKLAFFIVLCAIMDCGTFGLAYCHPEWIIPLENTKMVYIDALFSVLAVGIATGGILKYQIKIFGQERAVVVSQKDEIEKMSDSKNAFFANMSHEIRTPINTIVGLNEMILRKNPEAETQEYARNIQMASKMLLNLVNDILDLSQIEMKRMEIVPVQYQMRTIFEELIDMIQVRTKEKNLKLFVEIDRNLPSILFGDEKRIKQILLNILTNAVKYTEKGSVTLSAYTEKIGESNVRLKISVADTGIGIRKEDLDYLYDIFKRIDREKNSKIEGSGLGLSITKQLIDMMGGEITVDSIYTKGSTFTIILEQEVVDKTPIGEINFLEKQEVDIYQYKPSFEAPEGRILIVDDTPMNLKVEQQLLQDTKLQIDLAQSGVECLKKAKQKYYHVILLDNLMTEMTGAETLKELRRQENGLCRESSVLLLTASSSSEAKRICEENGFDGYLEKPITGKRLEHEVLKFLPKDIVEFQLNEPGTEQKQLEVREAHGKRKKNIYITTDCVCDLPEEYLESYNIKMMYFYVKTEQGRFADTKEMDSDNLFQYLSSSNSTAYSTSVSVEEYEEFFAEALTQAEHVIHISIARQAGKSYDIAVEAAKGFDHVKVIDSGHISCGMGLIALYAAKLAKEGTDKTEILESIEKCKGLIDTSFIMPSIQLFHKNGYADPLTAKICTMFQFHPVVKMMQSKPTVVGVRRGNLENAWRGFIHFHLRKKKKISTDVIFITHVGCSVKQLEFIKQEVLKCVEFEKVIIQKASCSTACNAGQLALGFAYYRLK